MVGQPLNVNRLPLTNLTNVLTISDLGTFSDQSTRGISCTLSSKLYLLLFPSIFLEGLRIKQRENIWEIFIWPQQRQEVKAKSQKQRPQFTGVASWHLTDQRGSKGRRKHLVCIFEMRLHDKHYTTRKELEILERTEREWLSSECN